MIEWDLAQDIYGVPAGGGALDKLNAVDRPELASAWFQLLEPMYKLNPVAPELASAWFHSTLEPMVCSKDPHPVGLCTLKSFDP
jgi:hypothetical protein